MSRVNLEKLLIEDEENDWITVSSDTELQEAFKFGAKQNQLNIKAMCTKKPEACFSQVKPRRLSEVPTFVSQPLSEIPNTDSKPKCSQPPQQRHRATCDSCQKCICGIRYKCSVCADYDLCSACEELNLKEIKIHPQKHYFLKSNTPIPLKRHLVNPFAQPKSNSKDLEERVAAAENRILTLESKFKACEVSR